MGTRRQLWGASVAGSGTAGPTARDGRVAKEGRVYHGFLSVGTGPTAHRGWPGLVLAAPRNSCQVPMACGGCPSMSTRGAVGGDGRPRRVARALQVVYGLTPSARVPGPLAASPVLSPKDTRNSAQCRASNHVGRYDV